VTVIPVLVDEAPMPSAEQLPQDLRKLCDQQARKIGDTHARRKADLEVLVEDIVAVGGIMVATRPDAHHGPAPTPERTSWLKLDVKILASAFTLTLLAGMYAYLSNRQVGTEELLFLLLVFCALVLGVRGLWRRLLSGRKRRS
jgi:hypothetical protein